jgi:hypothetical protein
MLTNICCNDHMITDIGTFSKDWCNTKKEFKQTVEKLK